MEDIHDSDIKTGKDGAITSHKSMNCDGSVYSAYQELKKSSNKFIFTAKKIPLEVIDDFQDKSFDENDAFSELSTQNMERIAHFLEYFDKEKQLSPQSFQKINAYEYILFLEAQFQVDEIRFKNQIRKRIWERQRAGEMLRKELRKVKNEQGKFISASFPE